MSSCRRVSGEWSCPWKFVVKTPQTCAHTQPLVGTIEPQPPNGPIKYGSYGMSWDKVKFFFVKA